MPKNTIDGAHVNTTMKPLILALMALLCLQACVAAFVAGAAAGGLVVYDKRDLMTMNEDNSIRHQLTLKLIGDPAFQNSHIVVASFNHVVLLAGQAPDPSLRVKAEQIAYTIPKVARVYNEIVITSPSSMMTRSSDAWITAKIKTEMLTKKGLRSSQIKVVTENGTVYLMGHVSHEQADLAVNIARRVSGTQQVVKIFQYTDE